MNIEERIKSEVALLKKLKGIEERAERIILVAMYREMINSYERILDTEHTYDLIVNDQGRVKLKRMKNG